MQDGLPQLLVLQASAQSQLFLSAAQRDLPYELDSDLKTQGRTTLGGAVDTEKQYFGAHFRITTEPDETKRLIGFNFLEETTLGGGNGVVHFWEFDEQFKQLHKIQHKMPVGLTEWTSQHLLAKLFP